LPELSHALLRQDQGLGFLDLCLDAFGKCCASVSKAVVFFPYIFDISDGHQGHFPNGSDCFPNDLDELPDDFDSAPKGFDKFGEWAGA
jgi:hypothetical protein